MKKIIIKAWKRNFHRRQLQKIAVRRRKIGMFLSAAEGEIEKYINGDGTNMSLPTEGDLNKFRDRVKSFFEEE
jgi:hypothetical protein